MSIGQKGFRQVDQDISGVMKSLDFVRPHAGLSATLGMIDNVWRGVCAHPARRSSIKGAHLHVSGLRAKADGRTVIHAANWNGPGGPGPNARMIDDEQARFEASIARELCGDVDF